MTMISNSNTINTMNRPVLAIDIAEKLGIGKSTVVNCLNDKHANLYKKETVYKVRKAAEEMGYDKQLSSAYGRILSGEARRKVREPKNYRGGNFRTKEEELARMKALRAEGYTNAQIAKKIGRSYAMVIKDIGKQDPELTKISYKLRGQRQRAIIVARVAYLRNKLIAEYNAKVVEMENLKEQAAQAIAAAEMLNAELAQQKPAIEKLAAKTIPAPRLDLSSLTPTLLQ